VRIPDVGCGKFEEAHAGALAQPSAPQFSSAVTPSGTRGVLNDAISIYFADATLASAFVARWCAVRKAEMAGGVSTCARMSRRRGSGRGCIGRRDARRGQPCRAAPPGGGRVRRKPLAPAARPFPELQGSRGLERGRRLFPVPPATPALASEPLSNFPKVALHPSSFPGGSVIYPVTNLACSVPEPPAMFTPTLVLAPGWSALPAALPPRPSLDRDDVRLSGGSRSERTRGPLDRGDNGDYTSQ